MKKYATLCPLLMLSLVMPRIMQGQQIAWALQAQGSYASQGSKICFDANGNILVAGTTRSSAVLCNQSVWPGDFVAKFSSAGQCLWIRSMPGRIADLEADKNNNIYVAATYTGSVMVGQQMLSSAGQKDIYLSKISAQGLALWAVSTGGKNDDEAKALAVDANGHAWLSGTFSDTIFFDTLKLTGQPDYNGFLAKYSGAGQPVRVHSVNVHMGFNYSSYEIFDVFSDLNTVYWIMGNTGEMVTEDTLFSTYYTDVTFAMYDTSGNLLGEINKGYDKGTDIVRAFSGQPHRLCWVGSGGSQYGQWESIIKHDSLMNIVSTNTLCHPNWCYTSARSAGFDQAGNLYGICNFTDYDTYDVNNQQNWIASQGASDFYLISFDAAGHYQGRKHWGNHGNDIISDMIVSPSGDCYVTGFFTDTLMLDATSLQTTDSATFFIARINTSSATPVVYSQPSKDMLVTVYPNPGQGKFKFVSAIEDARRIRVYNAQGKQLYDLQFNSAEMEVDLTAHPRGIYFAEVISGSKREIKKIVLE